MHYWSEIYMYLQTTQCTSFSSDLLDHVLHTSHTLPTNSLQHKFTDPKRCQKEIDRVKDAYEREQQKKSERNAGFDNMTSLRPLKIKDDDTFGGFMGNPRKGKSQDVELYERKNQSESSDSGNSTGKKKRGKKFVPLQLF